MPSRRHSGNGTTPGSTSSCGGNPLFPGRPVFTQAAELAAAHAPGYTVGELVDFAGVRYAELDGEAEIRPDIWVIPTPGHTAGHQSLAVRCADGTVILAGQSHDNASAYTGDQLAFAAGDGYPPDALPPHPAWIERLHRFDPARVLFAHDLAVWEPSRSRPGTAAPR